MLTVKFPMSGDTTTSERESLAVAGAPETDRHVVVDQPPAAPCQNGWAAGEARALLLAPAGREPPAPTPVRGDAAADLGLAGAGRLTGPLGRRSNSESCAFARRMQGLESDTVYDTRRRSQEGARARLVANDRLRHMLIGYARVSKADGSQSLDQQRDALLAAGVDAGHVYHDVRVRRTRRPTRTRQLHHARSGRATGSSSGSSTASAAPSPTWPTPCGHCQACKRWFKMLRLRSSTRKQGAPEKNILRKSRRA